MLLSGALSAQAGYADEESAVCCLALQVGANDVGRACEGRIPITRAVLTDPGVLR